MEFNATFIVSAISFVIFTILMNAIFYKPLNRVVTERQKFLEDTNEDVKLKQKKAAAIIKDKELKIEKTKHDAKKIITTKADATNQQKAELTSNSQKNAHEEISVAKDSLNHAVNETKQVLDDEVKNLAGEIVTKILGSV